MAAGLSILILAASVVSSYCWIEHMPLPGRMQDCFDRFSHRTSITETVGESIAAFCFDQYIWKAAREHGWKGFNITRETYEWVNSLLQKNDFRRQKRQARQLRIRKEYRRLSEEERASYHRAIQLLKADTSILPNRYDALSAIHQGIITTSAHGGPNFLPWHRVYVLMFENALREMVPGVTVPYWDSTLDEPLPDPTQSVLFTETFLGDGFGIVETGPFAHWNTLSGPLTRNIGQSGELFKKEQIDRIVRRLRLAEITEPNAPLNSSLEFHHNDVHIWIDGQMGSLNTAAHDPVFWVHHSYVDYVWEMFRRRQKASGVNPERDYPTIVNDTLHMPMATMGLSNFRNMDGLSDIFTNFYYTYEPSPTCSRRFPDCGSRYLRCMMINFQPRCVSVDWTAAPRPSPLLMGFGRGGAAASLMAAVRNQQVQAFQQQQLQQQMAMRQNLLNVARMRQMAAASSIARSVPMAPTANLIPAVMGMPRMPSMPAMPSMPVMPGPEGGPGPMPVGEPELEDAGGGNRRRRRYTKRQSGMPPNTNHFGAQSWSHHSAQPLHAQGAARSGPVQASDMQMSLPSGILFQNASSMMMSQSMSMCPAIPMSHGYQNTFAINGYSDIGQWVYIPVKIVFQRPPTYRTYSSYPVVNGEADEEHDIYSPGPRMHIQNYVIAGKPAFYSKCSAQASGAGKVYISSQGINYMGNYKEYAIVDQRLAVSISTAYVAVKSPEFGATEVFLSAYDTCGRMCQPYCKVAGAPGLQMCSGAFRITSQSPKLYGLNYGEAVSNLWQYSEAGGVPRLTPDNVYIEFYCSFSDSWPFVGGVMHTQGSQMQPPAPAPVPAPPVRDDLEPVEHKQEGNESIVAACNIGHGCIITGPCEMCREGMLYACAGLCSLYTSCQNGLHYKRTCEEGTWFNPDEGMCVPGQCIDRPFQWWHRQMPVVPDLKK